MSSCVAAVPTRRFVLVVTMLLEEFDTEFGNIRIVRSRDDGTLSYMQGNSFHSQARPDGTSTCAYVHVMYSLIRQSQAQRILIIGCAGGTLATMLYRLGCDITMVDINPLAFTLARKYFKLPDELDCRIEDGLAYLQGTDRVFDAVAIDAFTSDGTVPAKFSTQSCFQTVKSVLSPAGIVVENVIVTGDCDPRADHIAREMQAAGFEASLFDWPRRTYRNVLVAGNVADDVRVSVQRKPVFVKDEMRGISRRRPKRGLVDRSINA